MVFNIGVYLVHAAYWSVMSERFLCHLRCFILAGWFTNLRQLKE